jgi:D-alanyl-D-alanine carboxypeptidase (penicillin-binding protein 5/6)
MRALLALLSFVFPAALYAQLPGVPNPPPIAARAFVLTDFNSGQPLVSHNPGQRVEPASLTKLMTAYLTFAAL